MRKRTKNQELVFQVLNHSEVPLSAYDILDALRDNGFRAPLQVYRALDRLMADRMVHRLESLNAYVACRHDHTKHDSGRGAVLFMICDKCGRTGELADQRLGGQLQKKALAQGFAIAETMVEMRGLCSPCAESRETAN